MIRRTVVAVLLAVLAIVTGYGIGLAQSSTSTMQPGERLRLTCATALSGTIDQNSAVLTCATLVPPSTSVSSSTPLSGGPDCTALHASYLATGPDGQPYPTWHPPSDGSCHFGHEHGSDPARFPFPAQPPAFGYTGGIAGDNEPHNGFKLFVVDDTARGLWWRLTFHQGSGRPNRAFTRFHSLDLLVHRAADGQKLADVHLMADTGGARKKCDKSTVILPGDFFKLVPTDDCLTDFYESWPTRLQVGTLFRYSGSIDIDNATTAISRNADGSWSDTRVVYVASVMSNPCEPLDAHADCNRLGDKRSVIAPRLFMQNTTRDDTIRTDHLGNIVASGGIVQFLLRDETIDQGQTTNFANGIDGGDRMIYRPLASCTDTGDCNPRNFSDGTVTPPN